jgi:hypothetical protein
MEIKELKDSFIEKKWQISESDIYDKVRKANANIAFTYTNPAKCKLTLKSFEDNESFIILFDSKDDLRCLNVKTEGKASNFVSDLFQIQNTITAQESFMFYFEINSKYAAEIICIEQF